MRIASAVRGAGTALVGIALAAPLAAQEPTPPAGPKVARIVVQPATLTLDVGDTVSVKATPFDSAGKALQTPVVFFSSSSRQVSVDPKGLLEARGAGEVKVFAFPFGVTSFNDPARAEITVTVRWPQVKTIAIAGAPPRYYAGTTVRHRAVVTDASGAERRNVDVSWRSSNDAIVRVDRFGDVTAVRPGTATLTATGGGVSGTRQVTVVPFAARTLTLTSRENDARTGDVIHFTAAAKNAAGRAVTDVPITYSLKAQVEDTVMANEAPAEVDQKGRFVAQRAGNYTVFATSGNLVAHKTVAIAHRHVVEKIPDPAPPTAAATAAARNAETGWSAQGAVREKHSSDIWVWSGKDGKDYAITGTWGADGNAYFWDVTNPGSPQLVDSVQVDARTVNDVKVDEERELCFMTREGASNRKNGFVVLDCSNPRDVKILSTFDDGLYGGVHNIYYWNKRLFPINAGTRFDIINVEDPAKPFREGFFELSTPGHGIHDVWVLDGIAYASQWQDGVILVDVGNGKYGGTPAKPVQVSSYKYPIGATHSAFPYQSKATGKFYVFVGDEQFPYGLDPDRPEEAGGYIHIVDFTDIKNPEEVARYQIPEAGPHNFWIQNDTMYVAYYNAGLRVVDVSGELKGNLYEQGRELARFQARDPKGKVANAPMAWGPQPHKGHIFFSDFNSGLWAVKLPEKKPKVTP